MYPYSEYPLLWMKGLVDVQLFGAVYLLLQRAYDLPWREPVVNAGTAVVMIGWFIPLMLALYLWAFTYPVARFERLERISTAAMMLAFLSVLLLPIVGTAFAQSLLAHAALGWHPGIGFVAALLVTVLISMGGATLVQIMITAAATRRHEKRVAQSRARMKARE
ncbi:MAG: hypothetical protein AAF787_07180 [Chloroflexota bacterium]